MEPGNILGTRAAEMTRNQSLLLGRLGNLYKEHFRGMPGCPGAQQALSQSKLFAARLEITASTLFNSLFLPLWASVSLLLNCLSVSAIILAVASPLQSLTFIVFGVYCFFFFFLHSCNHNVTLPVI